MKLVTLVVSVVLVTLMPISAASAKKQTLSIDLKPVAQLTNDGSSVRLSGKAMCPSGTEVLEAFAYASQDDAYSNFGYFNIPCDGQLHPFAVTVTAFDEATFERGAAHASAYLLVIDRTTDETQSTGDSGTIKIR